MTQPEDSELTEINTARPLAKQPDSSHNPADSPAKLDKLARILRVIYNPKHRIWFVFLFSIALIVAVFPDVFFRGSTLSVTGQSYGMQHDLRSIRLFPQPLHRVWWHGFSDPGGAMWQSDPMLHFMRFCIFSGESPYWNPYSGAGQLGPETLVDLKFAFHTVLVALLGGSEATFTFTTLFLYSIAIFCLFTFINRRLHLSAIASAVACIVFLLNGYNITNLCTNTSQVYVYYPVLLLLLCDFANRPTAIRFVLITACFAVALSTTFLPICFLVLISTFVISCAFTWSVARAEQQKPRLMRMLMITSLQALAAILGLLGLSFLYFPIIESFFVIDPVSMYNSRVFHPANINSLLSFFTPKHFWEEYAEFGLIAMRQQINPNFVLTNVMFHFGITPSLIASASLTLTRHKFSPVLMACWVMLIATIGRIFAIPVINDLIGVLPGLRSIGEQYWFSVIGVVYPVLVAFGVTALGERKPSSLLPTTAVAAIIVCEAVYLNSVYGFAGPHPEWSRLYILLMSVILVLSIALIGLTIKLRHKMQTYALVSLAILLFFELDTYVIHFRYPRSDQFLRPDSEITFLKRNVGLNRVATIGPLGLPPEFGSAYQVQQIESLNMNVLPSYQTLFQDKFLKDPAARWGIFPSLQKPDIKPPIDMQMLSLLGVKYIVVPNVFTPWIDYFSNNLRLQKAFFSKSISIYENPNPVPKAYLATRLLSQRGTPDGLNESAGVSCTVDSTLLSAAKRAGITINGQHSYENPQQKSTSATSVHINQYHNALVTLDVSTSQPSLLVLMDNWHPNWKCEIDGKPAYIGVVNASFRGVVLPAGQHSVVFHYQPATLSAGLTVSAAVWATLLILMAFKQSRLPVDRKNQEIKTG